MSLENKLRNMGFELPETQTPVATYVPAIVDRGAVNFGATTHAGRETDM